MLTLTYRGRRRNARAGLVEDDIDYRGLGVPLLRPDPDAGEFRELWRTIPWRHRATLWCVLPFWLVADRVAGPRHTFRRYARLAMDDLPSNEEVLLRYDEIEDVLLDARDARVLDALGAVVAERGEEPITVGIVYGAGHVPAVVQGLIARHGYRVTGAEWVTAVAF